MSSWLSFLLVASAAIAIAEGRAAPSKPVSVTLDSYGNPAVFVREKRAPIGYPHRTMMFTGYYRPVRRTNEAQPTGVFAQGNAVSGGTYLGEGKTDYLERGPEPIDESAVSSSEAEAAPTPLEHNADEDQQVKYTPEHQQQDEEAPSQQQDQTPSDPAVDAPQADEAPLEPTKAPKRPVKPLSAKKTKKRPTYVESDESVEADDEDADDDEADDDDSVDHPAVPFIPFKSNRRRNNMPNLNNFFPMVFSYPRVATRGDSPDYETMPGMITAIANSYSTGKTGVASSVATAYGGTPQGKKQRRAQVARE